MCLGAREKKRGEFRDEAQRVTEKEKKEKREERERRDSGNKIKGWAPRGSPIKDQII